MPHTILSLQAERFDTRAVLGGCLLNIDGETFDCVVDKDSANFTSPTYTVQEKTSRRQLCTFRPYHLSGGPLLYQVAGASEVGGDATLIVPRNGMLDEEEGEDQNEEGWPCG